MTARQGLGFALAGFVSVVCCVTAGLYFPDFGADTSGPGSPNIMAALLIPIGFLGFIVMGVGLVMASVAMFRHRQPRMTPSTRFDDVWSERSNSELR